MLVFEMTLMLIISWMMKIFTPHGNVINLYFDVVPWTAFNQKHKLRFFYNGLNSHTRDLVNASANGPQLDCTYNNAVRILERIAQNDYQYLISKAAQAKTTPGVIELDAITALSAQVSSLTNMIKNMQGISGVAPIQVT